MRYGFARICLGGFLGRALSEVPRSARKLRHIKISKCRVLHAKHGSRGAWMRVAPACGFACKPSLCRKRKSNNPLPILPSVTPSRSAQSAGILTCCPLPAAFAIGLGPTHPPLMVIAEETLGFRRSDISSDLRLPVPTFSLPDAPVALTGQPSSQRECSSTTPRTARKL